MPKVTSKLQITIPKRLAEQVGISAGSDGEFAVVGEGIRMTPAGRRAGADLGTAEPGSLPYEMASLCRTKMLRRPEVAQRLLDCHRSLSQVGVRLMEPDWDGLPPLAQRWAFSVYDAAHLQLALRTPGGGASKI